MTKFPIIFSISVLCLSVLQGTAQKKVVLDVNPPPPAPARSIIKSVGNAEVLYNEKKDESTARSKAVSLFRNDSGWGSFSTSFQFAGKTVRRPKQVTLSVFIAARDRAYVDDLSFAIYADGKNLFNGVSELKDGRTNGKDVYSSVQVAIKRSDFEKIATAGKLMLKVGPTSFELSAINLSGVRDLLKIISDAS